MSDPACITCKHSRLLPLDCAECSDPAKRIYFIHGDHVNEPPDIIPQAMTCCNWEAKEE